MAVTGKGEFVEKLSKTLGLSKKAASDTVNVFLSLVGQELKSGNEVVFNSFGKFYVAQRKERTATNLRTKEKIHVPAKKVPVFKFSGKFKSEFV
jgi:DNA-binding protein HU-beta